MSIRVHAVLAVRSRRVVALSGHVSRRKRFDLPGAKEAILDIDIAECRSQQLAPGQRLIQLRENA
jgi:hypothetical protein